MSYTFNMVGGGGGSLKDTDAILTVTVPTGSTVTMTKGGVTLTPTMWVQAADNTLDCALFVIPPSLFDNVNAWTVTASLSGDTASGTVTIDSNEQYDVYLSYTYYLYREGNEYSAITGGWTILKQGSTYIASKEPTFLHLNSVPNNSQCITMANLVSFDGFNYLKFTLKEQTSYNASTSARCDIQTAIPTGPESTVGRVATLNIPKATIDCSIDISNISSFCCVCFRSINSLEFNVTKVWLE